VNLVISMATRGRPEKLVETIKRSVVNWTHPETVMEVQIDHDDPASFEACEKARIHDRVVLNVRQREDTIAEKWNRSLARPADVYLVVGDDDPYVTPGYDSKILEAAKRFPDGIGMVYGGMANLSFSGSVAPTSGLCRKMGYIQPAYFPYWFVDHWTDDICRMIGRISVADIKTDQRNVGVTQEFREPWWWATFFDACYLMRRREARAIIDADDFMGEEWHKELLRTHHPLIEQRSRMLNDSVRWQFSQPGVRVNKDLSDPRYVRVKDKARDMLKTILADPDMPKTDVFMFSQILMPPTTVPSLQRAYA